MLGGRGRERGKKKDGFCFEFFFMFESFEKKVLYGRLYEFVGCFPNQKQMHVKTK